MSSLPRTPGVPVSPAAFARVEDGGVLSYAFPPRNWWRRAAPPAPAAGPRVLLLTSSLGSGHVRAAQAIEAALLERAPDARVAILDFWSLIDEKVAWAVRNTYLRLVREQPELFDRIYRLDQRMWRALLERSEPLPPAFADVLALVPRRREARVASSHSLRSAWDGAMLPLLAAVLSGQLPGNLLGSRLLRLALVQSTVAQLTRRLASRVRAFAPGAIVATQMNSAALLSTVRHRLSIPTIGVPTDFGLHDFWIHPAIDRYCVAHEAIDGLDAGQVDASRVIVTGIPLMPGLRNPPSREAARRELGLDADTPVVLVAGGGLGLGVEEIAAPLLAAGKPLRILAVTGRNAAAGRKLHAMAAAYPGRLHVRDWTDQMEVFMRAADIVVGKPGGLTVAETLACGRPLIATGALGGQESFNVRFLERHQAGRLIDKDHIARHVLDALADRDGLRQAGQRAWRLGRRDGAERIALLAEQLAVRHEAVAA
jgi:UDP-N-acetylglucosamine:LPS N-acetylglucosamine transferase